MIIRRAVLVGILGLLTAPSVRADLIYFTAGGQAQLPTRVDGENVEIRTPSGPKLFPRSEFLAIVPETPLEQEWEERNREATRLGTTEARFAAGWWALENGLTYDAIAAFDSLRPTAANHPPSQRVVAMLDQLKAPCSDPDLGSLRLKLRPFRFRELRSAHVLLLHQGNEAEAQERLDVLERVVQTFLLSFQAQGLDLQIPKHRLVSVYFQERADYVRLLRSVESSSFLDTQGYYHPTLKTVFAFDTRSSEEQKTGRRAIANRKRDGAPAWELDRRELLLDLQWRATDFGIAAHETIHLLTAESGLSPRFNDFPHWLHEGLAAQYEVVRGGHWAGFGRTHDIRLPDWRAIHPVPRLVPLVRDSGMGHGYKRDLYAESWALVYFLRKTHPQQFSAFLDYLRSPSGSATMSRGDRALEAFRSVFGSNFASLENEWRAYMTARQTPLEAAKPARTAQPVSATPSDRKSPLVADPNAH